MLTSHQCGLDLIPACCHLWIAFVVVSCLAPRVFLQVFCFSSTHRQKPTFSNHDSTRIDAAHDDQLRLALNTVIYIFIILLFISISIKRNSRFMPAISPSGFMWYKFSWLKDMQRSYISAPLAMVRPLPPPPPNSYLPN